MDHSKKNEVYFCDYTKNALENMKKYGLTNADIQEIFNRGFSESLTHKFLDKDGYRIGVYSQYDGYTLRHVIISVYKRPLIPKGKTRN